MGCNGNAVLVGVAVIGGGQLVTPATVTQYQGREVGVGVNGFPHRIFPPFSPGKIICPSGQHTDAWRVSTPRQRREVIPTILRDSTMQAELTGQGGRDAT